METGAMGMIVPRNPSFLIETRFLSIAHVLEAAFLRLGSDALQWKSTDSRTISIAYEDRLVLPSTHP
jgi:hypothetical protein